MEEGTDEDQVHSGGPAEPAPVSGAGHEAEARALGGDGRGRQPDVEVPEDKRHRSSWMPKWETVHVKVTAEDGTWGLGQTTFGRATAAVIEDHFAPVLAGESCFAIEKCWT